MSLENVTSIFYASLHSVVGGATQSNCAMAQPDMVGWVAPKYLGANPHHPNRKRIKQPP